MNTFSANEVVAQVEGLNTIKTLKRWQKAVEENFGTDYFSYSSKNGRTSATQYSLDEVRRFQFAAMILSSQPHNRKNLRQAIITAFSSEEPYVKPKTELEMLESTLNSKIADLANENNQLRLAVQDINQRLLYLAEQLSDQQKSKPKFFKKK